MSFSKHLKTTSFTILFFTCCISLAGCKKNSGSADETDAFVSSSIDKNFFIQTMGDGLAAKKDSYLYYGDGLKLYEVNLTTGESAVLSSDISGSNLNIFDDTILFSRRDWEGDGIYQYNFQTGSIETLYNTAPAVYLYATDAYAYALPSIEGILYRINRSTGEAETLVDDRVLQYAKCGDTIYYITTNETNANTLWALSERDGTKEQIQLPFFPIKLFVDGTDFYLSEAGTWKLHVYHADSGETEAIDPVKTLNYQIFGDTLYYLDENQESIPLMKYNLKDGSSEQIADNVFKFCCFEDESIFLNLFTTQIPGTDSSSNDGTISSTPSYYYIPAGKTLADAMPVDSE